MKEEKTGCFLVLEGPDGIGKGVQIDLFLSRLKQENYFVKYFKFPDYGTLTGDECKRLQVGYYGDPVLVNPFLASPLYAIDRFDKKNDILNHLEQKGIALADRYKPSNDAYQLAKINDPKERKIYMDYFNYIEFELNNIPHPDLTFLLDVNVDIAFKNANLERESDKNDSNMEYQKRVHLEYARLANDNPHWRVIDCNASKTEMKSPEEIHDLVFKVFLDYVVENNLNIIKV